VKSWEALLRMIGTGYVAGPAASIEQETRMRKEERDEREKGRRREKGRFNNANDPLRLQVLQDYAIQYTHDLLLL